MALFQLPGADCAPVLFPGRAVSLPAANIFGPSNCWQCGGFCRNGFLGIVMDGIHGNYNLAHIGAIYQTAARLELNRRPFYSCFYTIGKLDRVFGAGMPAFKTGNQSIWSAALFEAQKFGGCLNVVHGKVSTPPRTHGEKRSSIHRSGQN